MIKLLYFLLGAIMVWSLYGTYTNFLTGEWFWSGFNSGSVVFYMFSIWLTYTARKNKEKQDEEKRKINRDELADDGS